LFHLYAATAAAQSQAVCAPLYEYETTHTHVCMIGVMAHNTNMRVNV